MTNITGRGGDSGSTSAASHPLLSLDELRAWRERYASTPWNMLTLSTVTNKDASPMHVMASLFAHVLNDSRPAASAGAKREEGSA